jgi:hypothetical protein
MRPLSSYDSERSGSAGPLDSSLFRAACVSLTVLAVVACTGDGNHAPTAPEKVSIRALVTSAVAGRLSGDGQFMSVLPAPLVSAPASLDAAAAAVLAVQYVRVFGPFLRNPYEQLHGGPIDFSDLVAAPRVILAESPVAEPPADGGGPLRKAVGSYFLVDLHPRNQQNRVLTVGVSVHATDIHITDKGIAADAPYGNEFRLWVTPQNSRGEPSLTPEEAVERAFSLLGRRTAGVPRFVRASPDVAPQVGRWRLELESPVALVRERTNEPVATDVVFVDGSGAVQVPSRMTSAFKMSYQSLLSRKVTSVNIAVRDGHALDFDTVRPR